MKIFTAAFGLGVLALHLSGFDFVKDGKAVYRVELAEKSSLTEQLAKRELENYIRKMSGAGPAEKSAGTVVIGTLANTKELPAGMAEKLKNAGKADAFCISERGGKLYVIGNNPLGALYGAYEVLEKLGVRWFYPGELGEICPSKKTLILSSPDDFQKADFLYRTFSVCGSSSDFKSMFDWMARNKMHCAGAHDWQLAGMTKTQKQAYRDMLMVRPEAGGHEWCARAVPRSLFETHPEYFILRKGKRVKDGRVERCYSNPEVFRRAVEYYLAAMKKNPATKLCMIASDDSAAFCECEGCRKLGTYNGKFSISNLFHGFMSKVMAEVVKQYPDALIEVFAYWNYRPLPEDPAVRYPFKNAYILYAAHQRCYAHDFDVDHACNKSFVKEMHAWKDRVPALGLYDYRYDSRNFYVPFEFVMASDVRTFRKMGLVSWMDETVTGRGAGTKSSPGMEYQMISNWPSHYVAAKMLWNSSLDEKKLMDEAYDAYYGKAAGVMKKYHAFRKELWDAAPGHCFYTGGLRVAHCLTTPGADRKLTVFLDQALKVADSGIVKKRIEQDRFLLDLFWRKPAAALKKRMAQAKDVKPQKADGKITVDGIFNESTWLKAQPVTGFLVPKQAKTPEETTTVRVAYDKDALYVAVDAENKHAWSPVKANVKKKDGPVWEDDSIEIQIQPPTGSGSYYHLVVNTLGTVYDSECQGPVKNAKWDSKAEVKVGFADQTYRYEIRIPFDSVKCRPGALPWRFHVMRTTTNLQPPASMEWSSLDGIGPFQPDFFRLMTFGRNLIKNGNFAELVKTRIGGQEEMFPKYFEVYGSSVKNHKVVKTAKGHEVWSKGVLAVGFGVPKGMPEGSVYTLVVRAKGQGKIGVRTWSWEGHSARKNHRHLNLPKQALTESWHDYTFKIPYLPKETWMIVYIGGNVTLENISCTIAKE